MRERNGVLLVFEGIDGGGKSTQIRLLQQALTDSGLAVVVSREPSDGPWGKRLRDSARLGRLSLEEELSLFLQDREHHSQTLVQPALAEGKIVILDRYFYSTLAYQGARGADWRALQTQMRDQFPIPQAVFLLDLPPAISLQRITASRGEEANEFEREEGLTLARSIFLEVARHSPEVIVLDATRSQAEVQQEIFRHVATLTGLRVAGAPHTAA